ncbi:MAG: transcription antitermination factor NusB [Methylococcales bacterium]
MKKSRSLARRLAVQAIYEWQVSANPEDQIKQDFFEDNELNAESSEYFSDLLFGVASNQPEIDATMVGFVDRAVKKIDPVELAILRLGFYELIKRPDIPYRVSLNEWINLAKEFGAPRSHAYINGVLDKASQQLRSTEVSTHQASKHPAN